MKKAIIYVRVSSNEQVQGTSLDSQERACVEYAQNRDIEVVKIFIERGESATAANRTEFLKALEYCRKHTGEVTAFIVWKIDRFARNTTDHFAVRAKLTQYGVVLQSVTEPITQDHMGKMMETFLAGYAEFENEVRKQRCTGGMQARLREGIWCWSPPIGYKNSKRLTDRRKTIPDIPDEDRFSLIQRGLKLYKAGNHTITSLTEESNKWGLKTRTNRPMRKQLWETILADKFYAGILVNPWTKEEYNGLHKPMITMDEYRQIQMVKTRMSSNATAHRLTDNPDFPLRRFVLCECGNLLTASWHQGRSKKYAAYHCQNKGCVHCGHSIPKSILEDKFVELLKTITPSDEFLKMFEAIILDTYKNQHVVAKQEKEHYRRELKKLEGHKEQLLQMRINKEMSQSEYKEMKEVVGNQIAALNISKNEAEINELDMEVVVTTVVKFIRNLAFQWQQMNPKQRQRMQKTVLPKGITYQKSVGIYGTAFLSPIFRLNETFLTTPSELVAGAGIEPTIFRL
jgi:site-specific DNA recombinase